ncbi:MAG: acylphosphatase [Promethearchaeota archaeon]
MAIATRKRKLNTCGDVALVKANMFAEGRVQGVGFRWTVADTARDLGLSGLVRNLSDGRVQIFLEGQKEDITDFIRIIKSREGALRGLHPRVDRLVVTFEGDAEFGDAWRPYSGFEIDTG